MMKMRSMARYLAAVKARNTDLSNGKAVDIEQRVLFTRSGLLGCSQMTAVLRRYLLVD